LVFEDAPEPFHRLEVWARRRPKHGHDVRGPPHSLGFVPGTVIEREDRQGLWQGRCELVQPPLERPPVEAGQCEKAARPGRRCDRAVPRASIKLVGPGGDRGDAPGGKATPDDGQETQASVVLGNDLDRAKGGAVCEWLGEEGGQGRLQLGHRIAVFGAGEGRGRLGLADRGYRPNAGKLADAKATCGAAANSP
jgi:hypothetical protein